MPDGGKLILHTYSNKDQVVLVVQDTGTGISEDKLPKYLTLFLPQKIRKQIPG
jgi:signal transduction histidine kinase